MTRSASARAGRAWGCRGTSQTRAAAAVAGWGVRGGAAARAEGACVAGATRWGRQPRLGRRTRTRLHMPNHAQAWPAGRGPRTFMSTARCVSSLTSRTTAATGSSIQNTKPPGRHHAPLCGSLARCGRGRMAGGRARAARGVAWRCAVLGVPGAQACGCAWEQAAARRRRAAARRTDTRPHKGSHGGFAWRLQTRAGAHLHQEHLPGVPAFDMARDERVDAKPWAAPQTLLVQLRLRHGPPARAGLRAAGRAASAVAQHVHQQRARCSGDEQRPAPLAMCGVGGHGHDDRASNAVLLPASHSPPGLKSLTRGASDCPSIMVHRWVPLNSCSEA